MMWGTAISDMFLHQGAREEKPAHLDGVFLETHLAVFAVSPH